MGYLFKIFDQCHFGYGSYKLLKIMLPSHAVNSFYHKRQGFNVSLLPLCLVESRAFKRLENWSNFKYSIASLYCLLAAELNSKAGNEPCVTESRCHLCPFSLTIFSTDIYVELRKPSFSNSK